MTQSTKFTWIPFFEEFAGKLLEYKDDRSLLINKLETIFENFGKLPFPRHGKDDIVFDIDPFTVFAFINRGISDKNRITLSEEIIKEFNLSSSAPLEFTGIPVANNRSLYFTGGKDNIDKLWDVFSRALVFSKDNSDNNKEAFSSSFDIALEIKGIKWNLTMGLFWIRPNTYLALDGKNREYIEQHTNLQRVIGEDYLDENKVPTGLEYLKICDNFTEAFKSDELEFNNFPDFSYTAWLYKPQTKDESYPEIVAESDDERFFFMNIEPKDFSQDQLGIEFSNKYSTKTGKKRRKSDNYRIARPEDKVLFYRIAPYQDIVALGKITKNIIGDILNYTNTENLENPISIAELNEYPELSFIGNSITVEQLSKDTYELLMSIIRAKNPKPILPTKTSAVNPEVATLENNSLQTENPNKPYTSEDFLNEVYMSENEYKKLVNLLLQKKNIILQGAPGTGKTFAAKRLAYSIMGEEDKSRVETIQFHQSYSYEDFVIGYKPAGDGFELKRGVFYQFCIKAKNNPDKKHFFIIDEINRGNMSKIFGELLMLIEKDHRGETLRLASENTEFSVPENIYIIGMMNTADRSLAIIDYALRRRFSFYEMSPSFESEGFKKYQENLENPNFDRLIEQVQELNREITRDTSLGEGFTIGHSYFTNLKPGELNNERLESIIDYDLLPTLSEYWFDDLEKVSEWSKRLHGAIEYDEEEA